MNLSWKGGGGGGGGCVCVLGTVVATQVSVVKDPVQDTGPRRPSWIWLQLLS